MKIVVLGASGQIGSLVYSGLKKTHEVVGTSRKDADRFLPFDPFKDDWSMLGRTDVLINCVGQINATAGSSFYHIHVELTQQIIAHRQQIGDPRIIQISALGASPEHAVVFLNTKGTADRYLLQHPNTAIVRPSIVCTHRTMLVKKMIMLSNLGRLLFGIVPVPKGFMGTRIQPIMPTDLADLVETVCLDKSVRTVDAVGPEAITFHQIIQMLMKERNQKLKMLEVPTAVTDAIVKRFLDPIIPKIINAQQYELLFQDNTGNAEVCEQLLGRGLLSTREFFRNELAIK